MRGKRTRAEADVVRQSDSYPVNEKAMGVHSDGCAGHEGDVFLARDNLQRFGVFGQDGFDRLNAIVVLFSKQFDSKRIPNRSFR